jgi:hypothetical protein
MIYLMKDAWNTVTPATVSDCFRKSSLLSGDVSVNNKTITEGEPAFFEWLKQSEEDSDHDSDENIEETVSAKQLVTYSQAQDAVQTFRNFLENSKTVEDSTFNGP